MTILLLNRAEVSSLDEDGNSLLHLAARSGNSDVGEFIIEQSALMGA
jgi:ankyrin repeat protein